MSKRVFAAFEQLSGEFPQNSMTFYRSDTPKVLARYKKDTDGHFPTIVTVTSLRADGTKSKKKRSIVDHLDGTVSEQLLKDGDQFAVMLVETLLFRALMPEVVTENLATKKCCLIWGRVAIFRGLPDWMTPR